MKTALITGASRGVGEAIAKRLLKTGWKVYGVSRNKPSIEYEYFAWLECDLVDPSSIEKLTVEEPSIDLLVSNAGVAFLEPATAVSAKSYAETYNVNVLAPMLLVAKLKEKVKRATIMTVSSVSDRLVGENFALYCSSKAANTRFFETLALELKEATVISLLPTYIDTTMLHGVGDAGMDWSHVLKVEEIAQLVDDLVSDRVKAESGSNIIVVNDRLVADLESQEKLYGYNVSTGELSRL